ncbi:FMN-dependent NADH-azoreductase [Herminiimonas fonticola]|uniref:FMN dependent NADH:quinone oxidoreductase n=1 Tax=Herminiimonas fonticola TaxID=303380 RepID=A0A4R6GG90_9BURK|nr:NAD(P)H-dependent oxidoreductase [Herminiimonas fonticola]RBA24759.1 Acyl carrier protein phosphodiesterase [Herminiimonas fonticola]TDN93873.1 FMN-dependent NADH-azoreductase [Herminiimonas fonticola]
MTRILLLNSGPHSDASHGYRLAREAIAASGLSNVQITERDLVQSPIPPIGRDYALAVTSHTPHDAEEFDWSERLIVELEQNDMLFIVTPMHNFTVPAALKLWIDHVIRINRSFNSTPQGKVGLMKDRPTFVLVSSGGFHVGERAKQADFLTPYLKYALASIGINDVHFFPLQGLVFGPEAVTQAVDEARQKLSEKLL